MRAAMRQRSPSRRVAKADRHDRHLACAEPPREPHDRLETGREGQEAVRVARLRQRGRARIDHRIALGEDRHDAPVAQQLGGVAQAAAQVARHLARRVAGPRAGRRRAQDHRPARPAADALHPSPLARVGGPVEADHDVDRPRQPVHQHRAVEQVVVVARGEQHRPGGRNVLEPGQRDAARLRAQRPDRDRSRPQHSRRRVAHAAERAYSDGGAGRGLASASAAGASASRIAASAVGHMPAETLSTIDHTTLTA